MLCWRWSLPTGAERCPMPKGPCGEQRPGDVIGAAIMVAKIATGEVEDNQDKKVPKTLQPKAPKKAESRQP